MTATCKKRDQEYQGFGGFVRAQRQALGLTQEQLAEAAGLSQKYVSLIESKREPGYLPPLETVRALARALRCSTEDLVRASGYINEKPDVPDLSDPRVLFFAAHAGELTEEEWAAIRTLIESLTEE